MAVYDLAIAAVRDAVQCGLNSEKLCIPTLQSVLVVLLFFLILGWPFNDVVFLRLLRQSQTLKIRGSVYFTVHVITWDAPGAI